MTEGNQGKMPKIATMVSRTPIGCDGGYAVHLVAEVDISTSPPTVIRHRGAVVLDNEGLIVFGGSRARALAVANHLARGEFIIPDAVEQAEENAEPEDEASPPFTI